MRLVSPTCVISQHTSRSFFIKPMCSLESFVIDLKGLAEGLTSFTFNLDDAYFEAIDAPEVSRGNVCSELSVRRTADCFTLDFHTAGEVTVQCDVCLDDMQLPVESTDRIAVKFGEEYEEDDDLITVSENEGTLDVSWLIYEFIALSIPIRHVHVPGECNPDMLKALEEHSPSHNNDADGNQGIDSRWSELAKLKL